MLLISSSDDPSPAVSERGQTAEIFPKVGGFGGYRHDRFGRREGEDKATGRRAADCGSGQKRIYLFSSTSTGET